MSKEFIKCLLGYMLIMAAVNMDSYFSKSSSDQLFSLQSLLEIVLVATGVWLIIQYHIKREHEGVELDDSDSQGPYWLFNIIDRDGHYHKVMSEKESESEARKEARIMYPSCIIASCRFYTE